MRRSLAENDLTVVSIFVNPAQFAPTEDLATYPRTLQHDLRVLEDTMHLDTNASPSATPRSTAALFLPSVYEMYPSGITQDVAAQKGTFVEVKGYGHQMEGASRPTFFRGVATVVTKLFNIIEVCAVLHLCIQQAKWRRNSSQPKPTLVKKISSKPSYFVVWSETSCYPTQAQKICTSYPLLGMYPIFNPWLPAC